MNLRHLRPDKEASLSLSARKLSLQVIDFANEFLLMKLRHKLRRLLVVPQGIHPLLLHQIPAGFLLDLHLNNVVYVDLAVLRGQYSLFELLKFFLRLGSFEHYD